MIAVRASAQRAIAGCACWLLVISSQRAVSVIACS
jgi:hypothetical protein